MQVDPSGVTSYTYSNRGLSVVTDALGETVTYAYDNYGNISTITEDAGKVTSITYDDYGRKQTVTTPDPDGAGGVTASVTTYGYDLWSRVDTITDALGGITSYTFDGVGNLLTLTDPENNETAWSYDPLNRVTMETNELNKTRSFIYDAMSNLVRKTDRNARVTQYEVDQMSRKTAEKWYSGTSSTPSVAVTTTQQGSASTTNEVQKIGYERSSGFGSMGGNFTLSFGGYTTGNIAAGASDSTVQTALEGLTSIGSGNVVVSKITNTSNKQEWQVTFQGSLAGANQAQIDIDITNITNPGPTPTQIETTLTEGTGPQSEIQTVALTDATGGTFRLAFGGQVTSPLAYNASNSTVDSALEALSTIGSGNVSVSLAGSTYTITFGGALAGTNVASLQADVSTATYGTVTRTISTTYNANSQVTQVTDPSATIDYTLDNLSRATSIVNTINGLTPTVTFDQAFSAASDRTQLKAKISSTNDFKTDFTFDTLGRMTDIVQQGNSGNTVASKHVTLAYNKLHQFTSIVRYESTSTSNYVATTDFGYDNLHRLTDIDHYQGGTTLNAYDYGYDFASRMTSVTTTLDGATSFTNDKTNQLTGADFTGQTDEAYTFDDNGNRIGGSYTVTANNLTSTDGTYNYLYDDEGNRTRRTKISDSSYEEYTWDYRNRLTAVTFKNSGGTVLKTVNYEYDAFNRLIRRTYDADGPGGGAAVDQFWAFDEGINPLIEFDAATAADVSHRYLWGPQVDQLFADEQVTSTGSAGNVLWALGDNLGTIRDIADLSAATTTVTNHRRFGAYGNLVSESNAAVDMIFAFTGKLYDEVTKLRNHLNRWTDGDLGQWLSEDPIGIKGQDPNFRRYAGNFVTNTSDPNGLIRYYNDPEFWRLVARILPRSASDAAEEYADWLDTPMVSPIPRWNRDRMFPISSLPFPPPESPQREKMPPQISDEYIVRRADLIDGLESNLEEIVLIGVGAGQGLRPRPNIGPPRFRPGNGAGQRIARRPSPRVPSTTSFGPKSIGAGQVQPPRVIQSGGHTISPRTRRELGLTQEEAKQAIEGLKADIGQGAGNHNHKIWNNGDVTDSHSGDKLGNLYDYVD